MSNPLRPARVRRAGFVLTAAVLLATVLPAAGWASAVNLGTAAPFVVLGGSTVTNTGPSVLNGDLGVFPGTAIVGFGSPAVVNGATHAGDAVAASGQSDLTTAYDVAAGQPVTADLTGQDLGGLVLTAGAYRYATSAQLTGQVTLDAAGDPAAQFVFMIGSTLTTASASSVRLVNGASPCNVFWQVGSSATLGTTTAFVGNVLAYTSISLDHAATVQGRMLARNGAVTLDDNTLDRPACAAGTGSSGGTSTTTQGTTTGGTTTDGSTPAAGGPLGSMPGAGNGTARLTPRASASPPAGGARCRHGFLATVRGTLIKRVVFSLGHRRIATRTGAPFHVYVRPAAGTRGVLRARVTFTDATRPRTLTFRFRACAAAVLRPRPGPSKFTG